MDWYYIADLKRREVVEIPALVIHDFNRGLLKIYKLQHSL